MKSLAELEQSRRADIWRCPSAHLALPTWTLALGVLVAFPFQIATFLFIPLIGQLIGVLSVLLTLVYLAIERSALQVVGAIGGIAGSVLLCGGVEYLVGPGREPFLYVLVGAGPFVSLLFLISAAAMVWRAISLREDSVLSNPTLMYQAEPRHTP